MMFDRILVPVDGSSRDAEAIEVARDLAERFAAETELLHVEGALTPLGQVLADNRSLEQQAGHLLQHGVRVHSRIEFGRPDKAIADRAQTDQAQLVVLAPHHRSHLATLGHPSVTERLLGRTPAPLLVWPDQQPGQTGTTFLRLPGSLILVPLDGSPLAEQALPYAVGFAREYARPLVLIRVVPPAPVLSAGPDVYRVDDDYQAQAEQEAHAYLSALRHRLSQEYAGLHVQSMRLSGEPWRELLRCAETHDGSLVVMSTHARRGIPRAVLGSVAAHLVRRSPLPMLIVPPGATCSQTTRGGTTWYRSATTPDPLVIG